MTAYLKLYDPKTKKNKKYFASPYVFGYMAKTGNKIRSRQSLIINNSLKKDSQSDDEVINAMTAFNGYSLRLATDFLNLNPDNKSEKFTFDSLIERAEKSGLYKTFDEFIIEVNAFNVQVENKETYKQAKAEVSAIFRTDEIVDEAESQMDEALSKELEKEVDHIDNDDKR